LFKFFKKKDITNHPAAGNRFKPKKGFIIALALILIGCSVGYYSYTKIQEILRPKVDYVMLPVPKSNIQVYTVTSTLDFELKPFPKGTENRGYLQAIDELSGKVTARPLEKDSPIMENDFLQNNQDLNNVQIISLNMDAARSSGAKPGDLVDIYLLSAADPTIPGAKVAQNVKVIDICDTSGKSLYQEGSVFSITATDVVKAASNMIYRVAINEEDVSKVITGSNTKNIFIAFARNIQKTPTSVASENPIEQPEKTDDQVAVSQNLVDKERAN